MSEDAAAPPPDREPSPDATEPAAEPSPPAATLVVAPTSTTAKAGRPDYIFLAVVTTVALATDLGSKWWAKARHADRANWEEMRYWNGHLAFGYAENPGGAFGLLGREPEWLRVPTFIVISIAAIWFILHLYRRLEPRQKALKLGLPLVFAGAIGNLADRVRYNYVVDFIDVQGEWVRGINGLLGNPSDHWPTFNVADIVIVAGVILMAIDMFQSRKPKTLVAPPAPEPALAGDAPAHVPADAPVPPKVEPEPRTTPEA